MGQNDTAKSGFGYVKSKANYIAYYKEGHWEQGTLQENDMITISAFSTSLHYGQTAFEGMKAYRRKDGGINLFRPEENAKRFQKSCARVVMPPVPLDMFIDAVKQTVLANEELVPAYGTGATLYIRPYMIGVGHNLGLRPSQEYIFGVLVSPVSSYLKEGIKPVKYLVTEYDRAAPNGTGQAKVGGNYGASLYPQAMAKQLGYADCVFLDPLTHTKIDEVGSANFFAITQDHRFVTPTSPSILVSITRLSLEQIARTYLNLNVEERDIFIDKLDDYTEAGACGTAVTVSSIGALDYQGKSHVFYSETEVGPYTRKLYDTLLGIQFGDIQGPEGWIVKLT